ncbi:MAG: subtilisin family serine protease [Chlamydiales bacterium]|jgi:subtilisin family serine protease
MFTTPRQTTLALIALGSIAIGQSQTSVGTGRPLRPRAARSVPGQMVLSVLPGADGIAMITAAGGTVLRTLDDQTFLLEIDPGSPGAVNLGAHAGTNWTERNFLLAAPEVGACGSTTGAGAQGCTIAFFDGDPAPERYYDQPTTDIIDLGAAQDLSAGIPSIVAVIDTGIDPDHALFAGRIFSSGYDFVDEDPAAWDIGNGIDDDDDGLIDEAWGHGTHIAGIIALINPDAWILPLRVLDSDGNGSAFHVALAIHAALDAGADVINLSLGMSSYSHVVAQAIQRADELKVTVVTSAGNTAGRVLFPGRLDDVVTVAALDANDIKADFSAFGPAVELSAPGLEIYSAMPGNAWAWWSGTSMSAAIVSGAVSLLHSVHGDPTEADADDALGTTSVDIDSVNQSFEELLGDGRIDVAAGAQWILTELGD